MVQSRSNGYCHRRNISGSLQHDPLLQVGNNFAVVNVEIILTQLCRFYHPAGPISWSDDTNKQAETSNNVVTAPTQGNDYVIKNATYVEEKETVTMPSAAGPSAGGTKKTNLKPSRSFKQTIRKPPAPAPPPSPPPPRTARLATPVSSSPPAAGVVVDNLDLGSHSPASSPHLDDCKVSEKMDSAYGTDSNRTASRNTESSGTMFVTAAGKSPTESYHHHTNLDMSGSNKSSSSAFNNDTYMSIENTPVNKEDQSYMSADTGNNTYQSVHAPDHDTSQDSQLSRVTVIDQSCQTPRRPRQDVLKRSPVMKDVTSVPPLVSTPLVDKSNNCCDKNHDKLHAPLTIIIPNISHQAFTSKPSQSR